MKICPKCGRSKGNKREMREILFRGKSIKTGKWVYGLFVMDAMEQVRGKNSGENGFICYYDKQIEGMAVVEVERETVCQYTGLTDKNNKKIFEGDIVSAHGYEGSISMDTDYWEIHWNHNFERHLYVWGNTVEITGNIFDGGFDDKESKQNQKQA